MQTKTEVQDSITGTISIHTLPILLLLKSIYYPQRLLSQKPQSMFIIQKNLIRFPKSETQFNKFVIPKIFNIFKIFQVDSKKRTFPHRWNSKHGRDLCKPESLRSPISLVWTST